MSCVIGLVADDGVYMGADSGFFRECHADALAASTTKLFRNGPFLIGCAGSVRFAQVMQFCLQPPEQPVGQDVLEHMCTSFVDSMRVCLTEAGAASVDNEGETSNNRCLVAYRGRLFLTRERILAALSIAERYCCGVRGPFIVEMLPRNGGDS